MDLNLIVIGIFGQTETDLNFNRLSRFYRSEMWSANRWPDTSKIFETSRINQGNTQPQSYGWDIEFQPSWFHFSLLKTIVYKINQLLTTTFKSDIRTRSNPIKMCCQSFNWCHKYLHQDLKSYHLKASPSWWKNILKLQSVISISWVPFIKIAVGRFLVTIFNEKIDLNELKKIQCSS